MWGGWLDPLAGSSQLERGLRGESFTEPDDPVADRPTDGRVRAGSASRGRGVLDVPLDPLLRKLERVLRVDSASVITSFQSSSDSSSSTSSSRERPV